MKINKMDHFVLTVRDINKTVDFYHKILNMEINHFNGRVSLKFSNMEIKLHQVGHEFEPKAETPTPGSGDLCFITDVPINHVIKELKSKNVNIEQGPVKKQGALNELISIYFRDPDKNLIEISNYNKG